MSRALYTFHPLVGYSTLKVLVSLDLMQNDISQTYHQCKRRIVKFGLFSKTAVLYLSDFITFFVLLIQLALMKSSPMGIHIDKRNSFLNVHNLYKSKPKDKNNS